MFKFFDIIVDFFQRIFSFISNIVLALGTALTMIKSSVTLPLGLVGYVPAILGSCIVVVVAVAVVKFIIGR